MPTTRIVRFSLWSRTNLCPIVLTALLGAGCAGPPAPHSCATEPGWTYQKSYQPGAPSTVKIGDRLLRLTSYRMRSFGEKTLTPTGNVTANADTYSIALTAGQGYAIKGRHATGDDASYAVIEPQDGLGILVADNGNIKGIVTKDPLSGAYRSTNYRMSLSDASVQLVSGREVRIEPESGKDNFEIYLDSVGRDSFTLSVRQLPSSSATHFMSAERLTFSSGVTTVIIKSLRLAIMRVGVQAIEFNVSGDCYR